VRARNDHDYGNFAEDRVTATAIMPLNKKAAPEGGL